MTTWGPVPAYVSAIQAAAQAAQAVLVTHGTVRYVDSVNGNAGNSGLAPDQALVTIDAAINASSAGDTIIVLEGHVETLADATSLVPDVAGLTIIGLGRGARRPTLTLSATGSNIPISGANVLLQNFLITTTGTINVTAAITITGPDAAIIDVEIRESAADSQVVDGIVCAATSDRALIKGLIFRGFLTGDADASAVSITGAVDGVIVEDFNLDGLFVAAAIENVTGVATNMIIRNGIARNRHATTDAVVTAVATSTGWCYNVFGRSATDDDPGLTGMFVGAAMQFSDIRMVNADAEHAAEGEVSDLDVTNTRSGKTFSTIA
jgi:hypothetical protein